MDLFCTGSQSQNGNAMASPTANDVCSPGGKFIFFLFFVDSLLPCH